MIRLRESFIKKVNKDSKFLEKFLNKWKKLVSIFNQRIKECEKANLSKLSDKNLMDLYNKFYQAYIDEYSIAIGLQDPFSMHADKFMKPLLEKILKKQGKENKINEYYAILTSPVVESFIAAEFRGRLKILKEINKKSSRVNKLLEEHSKRFFWIENNYAKVKVLDKKYFSEKIKKEMEMDINPDEEIKKMDNQLEKIKEDKKKLIKEFKNLIKITEVFAYMQDERKKYVLLSNHYQKKFLDETGRRLNLTEREMNYTVFPELKEMLLGRKIDRKKLAERYKHCLCIQTLDGYEVLEGKDADKIYDKIFNPNIKTKEIKGTCASRGKAEGIVRIIKKTHDLINVDKGDILVTSMTRPEMVTAMEKAAAIVTDEGGITCHAAIVSRELGIPCIIGAKIATKILKDGDLVEVDANKGIVRKI
ncbi:hypothetical protein KY343_01370 [Candidatus Woesearchaeota archaeon]|nr:hypothetical protein [Candidatus Woesearchaeota archaeon]